MLFNIFSPSAYSTKYILRGTSYTPQTPVVHARIKHRIQQGDQLHGEFDVSLGVCCAIINILVNIVHLKRGYSEPSIK